MKWCSVSVIQIERPVYSKPSRIHGSAHSKLNNRQSVLTFATGRAVRIFIRGIAVFL